MEVCLSMEPQSISSEQGTGNRFLNFGARLHFHQFFFIGTIVTKDASPTEGVARCTSEVNSSSKMTARIHDLGDCVLLLHIFIRFILFHGCALLHVQSNDTPTDHRSSLITLEKPAVIWLHLRTNFSAQPQHKP